MIVLVEVNEKYGADLSLALRAIVWRLRVSERRHVAMECHSNTCSADRDACLIA